VDHKTKELEGMLNDTRDSLCPWGISRSHGDPFVLFFLPPDFISIWFIMSSPSSPHIRVSRYPNNFSLSDDQCCNTVFIHTPKHSRLSQPLAQTPVKTTVSTQTLFYPSSRIVLQSGKFTRAQAVQRSPRFQSAGSRSQHVSVHC